MSVDNESKIRKFETFGFFLYHRSYRLTPVAVVITRFVMYAAQPTPSAQKLLDTPACRIIDDASFWRACSFELYAPRRDCFVPRRELFAPRRDSFVPRGELFAPRRDCFVPRRELFAPRRDCFVARRELLPPEEIVLFTEGNYLLPKGIFLLPKESFCFP